MVQKRHQSQCQSISSSLLHEYNTYVWKTETPLSSFSLVPTGLSCKIRKIAGCACTGNAGNVSPPPRVSDSDTDMHPGTCVTHVPWCMPELLTSGFLLSRWRGKHSRHSRCMRKPQIYVSGKRPMGHFLNLQNDSTRAWTWRILAVKQSNYLLPGFKMCVNRLFLESYRNFWSTHHIKSATYCKHVK